MPHNMHAIKEHGPDATALLYACGVVCSLWLTMTTSDSDAPLLPANLKKQPHQRGLI